MIKAKAISAAAKREKNSALAERPRPPQSENETGNPVKLWGKLSRRRKANDEQKRYLYRIAKKSETVEKRFFALKAAGALQFCNSRQIVEKKGDHFTPVGAWNCGKKYCAICANKKRIKLLRLFSDFFCNPDEKAPGRELLEKYDLALFTVTLQHSKKGQRSTPYYKELSTHFRNALKYGRFKQIIKGGFYNTEHTYGKHGHHIHRHALVLIPRDLDVINNYEFLKRELTEQWKQRTGGSFQVDLRPLGYDEKTKTTVPRAVVVSNISTYLLEITKYITKRDESGIIDWNIILAVEQNNRAKFYGRFGILHRVKELNLNQEKENLDEIPAEKKELYTCTVSCKFEKQAYIKPPARKIKITDSTHAGTPLHIIEKLPTGNGGTIAGEEKIKYRFVAVSYQVRNLQPFDNTKEARKQFQENIAGAIWNWRRDKAAAFSSGYTVDKWKQNREALKRWNDEKPFYQGSYDNFTPIILKYGQEGENLPF